MGEDTPEVPPPSGTSPEGAKGRWGWLKDLKRIYKGEYAKERSKHPLVPDSTVRGSITPEEAQPILAGLDAVNQKHQPNPEESGRSELIQRNMEDVHAIKMMDASSDRNLKGAELIRKTTSDQPKPSK